MEGKDLLDAMNEIDDVYVNEAANLPEHKKKPPVYRYRAAAACLLAALLCGSVIAVSRLGTRQTENHEVQTAQGDHTQEPGWAVRVTEPAPLDSIRDEVFAMSEKGAPFYSVSDRVSALARSTMPGSENLYVFLPSETHAASAGEEESNGALAQQPTADAQPTADGQAAANNQSKVHFKSFSEVIWEANDGMFAENENQNGGNRLPFAAETPKPAESSRPLPSETQKTLPSQSPAATQSPHSDEYIVQATTLPEWFGGDVMDMPENESRIPWIVPDDFPWETEGSAGLTAPTAKPEEKVSPSPSPSPSPWYDGPYIVDGSTEAPWVEPTYEPMDEPTELPDCPETSAPAASPAPTESPSPEPTDKGIRRR